MNIAVLTDVPILCARTMYLDELRKGLERLDVSSTTFLVKGSKLMIEEKLAFQRLLNGFMLLRRLTGFDLLHVQFSFPLGLLLAVSKRLHCKPVLIHTHGFDVFSVPSVGYGLRRNQVGMLLSKQAWARASRIITVCNKAKEELSLAGVPSEKINVLYNGVDTALFSRRRVQDAELTRIRERNELIFLNVAGLNPVKNQIALIQAFANLAQISRVARDAKLLICGGGPMKHELVATAHRLNVDRQLVFLGQRQHDQMPEIFSIADAFVLPSLSEAHPWSLLEAMSCGLPAIASAVGGIPETIQDDRLVFNPRSHTSLDVLTGRLLLLAEDAKKRRQIGARNRRIVLEKYTIELHVRSLLRIYRETVQ